MVTKFLHKAHNVKTIQKNSVLCAGFVHIVVKVPPVKKIIFLI